jgi:DNA-binding MarR family transcriptional regulator
MSTPPLPPGLEHHPTAAVANQLHSAAIRLLRWARRVDSATGLSPQRLSLLSVLVFGGPRTVGELAEIEMVSPPAVTKAVDALHALGLAQRRRASADRRQVVVSATDRGRELLEEGRRRRIELIADRLSHLDPGDLAALERSAKALAGLHHPDGDEPPR